jgi:hypothetical protein
MPPIFLNWSKCPAKLNSGNERLQQHIESILSSSWHPHARVIIESTNIRVTHSIIDSGTSYTSIPIILIIDIFCILPWLNCCGEFIRLIKLLLE